MYSNAMWKSLQEWIIVEKWPSHKQRSFFSQALRPLARAYDSMAKAYPDTEDIQFPHLWKR